LKYEDRYHHHPNNITITNDQVKALKFKALVHIQVKMKYGGGGSLRMKAFTLICECAIVKCEDISKKLA
jgi:hypothetical protein